MAQQDTNEHCKNMWVEPPMFDTKTEFDPNQKPLVVYKGVMKIRNFDSEDRNQIIPMGNIEFITRIHFYLTFHMKSGATHTIYVGDKSSTLDKQIMNEYVTFCTSSFASSLTSPLPSSS